MIPIQAKLLPATLTDITTAIALQDLPPALLPEAPQQDLTLTPTQTAEATQDLQVLPTTPATLLTATQDLPTVPITVLLTEAMVAVHTQDPPAAAPTVPPATTQDLQVVLPTTAAIQDPPTAATAVLPAEATQAPAAVQDLAVVSQEVHIQEAADRQAAVIQVAEAQEAVLLQEEDKYRIQNP